MNSFDLSDSEMDESKKEVLIEAAKVAILLNCFRKITHEKLDGSDYCLKFNGILSHELQARMDKVYELGDLTRLLTKRFIKTVRGSSYEVDIRMNESISLLYNICNQLSRELIQKLWQFHCSSLQKIEWEGKPVTFLVTDGLNLTKRSNYEALVQDSLLLEVCRLMPNPPEILPTLVDIVAVIKSKTQLKYVDEKSMMSQINKLESTGNLRPNMNNNQGFTGIKLFPSLCFFKLYTFEDSLSKNSTYMSKDAEDRLTFVGIGKNWQPGLAEIYYKFSQELAEIAKKSQGIELHLLIDEKATLKDKIVSRQLGNGLLDRRRKLWRQACNIIKLAAKIYKGSYISACFLTRQLASSGFTKLLENKREAESQQKLFILQNLALNFKKQQFSNLFLNSLPTKVAKLKEMIKLIQKMLYIEKLSKRTESFYRIKKQAFDRLALMKNVKIGDSILRNLFKYRLTSYQTYSMCQIRQQANRFKYLQELVRLLDKIGKEKVKLSLASIKEFTLEKKTIERKTELERQSVKNLRQNYLLNNLLFIFKLKSTISVHNDMKAGFNAINAISSEKKNFEEKLSRMCKKLDTVMKRKMVRMTIGGFNEYRTQELTHNLKIGFHFLECYIRRKTLLKSFRLVLNPNRLSRYYQLLHVLHKVVVGSNARASICKLNSIAERKRGLMKLHNLVRFHKMSMRNVYGAKILEHLRQSHMNWLLTLKPRFKQAAKIIYGLEKRDAVKKLKSNSQKVLEKFGLTTIKLEILLLKSQKKAYKTGFFAIHKLVVKKKHFEMQLLLVRKNVAATVIQSCMRMRLVRKWYLLIRWSTRKIQRAYRAYLLHRIEKKRKEQDIKMQRQRNTQIRQLAIQKMKENMVPKVNSGNEMPKPNIKIHHRDSRTPVRKGNAIKKPLNETIENLSQLSVQLQSTIRPERPKSKLKPRDKDPLQSVHGSSKHESLSQHSVSSKQYGMMKLNNDFNNREYVKQYKNRVISNYMKEREKDEMIREYKVEAKHLPLDRRYTEVDISTERLLDLPLATESNNPSQIKVKRESIHGLIEGVKNKISQIRRTERMRTDTN